MSDRLKRTLITATGAAVTAAAVAYGVPLDTASAVVGGLVGMLLGWAHLSKPGDK